MRVLAISHSCVTDVNQQQFVALRQLPGVEVALIVPANWKDEYAGHTPMQPKLLPSVDFPVHLLPVAVPGHVSLHFYKRLPLATLRAFQPDVLLSTQEPWSLSGLQAVWLAKRLHIPLLFQTNQNLFKRYPPPFCWIESLSYRAASRALAFSEEARQVMLRKGLKRPSAVVPYGTDLALFKRQPSTEMRRRLGLEGRVVLGYMGRFVPEKGLDNLIDAVALLRRQQPEIDLAVLMVGAGPEEENLRRRIAAAGLESCFVFAGSVPHTQAGAYMACMDIFVLPSRTMSFWKEQFGRVIIEAMACGVPVVGSDSGQIPHLIRDTGGGLVFAEGDVEDLAAQLRRIVLDPQERARLGEAGYQAVHLGYTFEAVARQLHALMQDALDERTLGKPAERHAW